MIRFPDPHDPPVVWMRVRPEPGKAGTKPISAELKNPYPGFCIMEITMYRMVKILDVGILKYDYYFIDPDHIF
jgi:hypothetical protein